MSLKSLEVPARAPMELLVAGAHPDATIYCHKLILAQQVPIDFGREVHGYAKHPTTQPVDISEIASAYFFVGARARPGREGVPFRFSDRMPVSARRSSRLAVVGSSSVATAIAFAKSIRSSAVASA